MDFFFIRLSKIEACNKLVIGNYSMCKIKGFFCYRRTCHNKESTAQLLFRKCFVCMSSVESGLDKEFKNRNLI